MAKSTVKHETTGPDAPKSPIPMRFRAVTALSVAVTSIVILLIIIYSLKVYFPSINLLEQIILGIFAVAVSGMFISRILAVSGYWGLYLLKTQKGLGMIDRISKNHKSFWKALVEWGFVLSFGLLTVIFFRKYVSKKMLAFGIISIIAMQFFVLPYLSIGAGFINTPQFSIQPNSAYVPSSSISQYLGYAFVGLSVIGGFALYILGELAYIAAVIIHGVASFAIAATTVPIAQAATNLPGPAGVPIAVVPFLNPSIALPLILSLILLVTLHEFAHGIIARQYGIKLKSIGTFIFGIIPGGAFVEPDEKSITKLSMKQQDMISIAGVSMNFLLTMVFFVLLIAMYYYAVPQFYADKFYIQGTVPGSPAANVLAPGSILTIWNGYSINNSSDLTQAAKGDTPYSTVSITTNVSSYSIVANATGKIGIFIGEESLPKSSGALFTVVNFLYIFIGLSFLLNFYVAIFNILPLPFFDGGRVYKLRFGDKKFRVLEIIAVIVFILIFIPWLWVVFGL